MAFLERNANRGSVSTGFNIANSCKFEADNTEYLERDPSSAGDRQKFTTSMWVKRTELGQASTIFGVYPTSSVGDTTVMQFGFMSTDKFQLGLQSYYVFNTTRLFRDTSAWYHIVVAFDTTQSTAANRIKLYVNGIQETAFDVEAYPNQNHSTGVNFTEPHRIGTLISNSWYFSGYIAEVNHVDGSQLAPTDFGEVDDDSGIWKPKKYTGSYGTNGFYLDFADASDLGDDESGNGNDWTENNITAADQATDTPTNNFCTLNPIAYNTTYTASEGNTKWSKSDTTYGLASGTHYVGAGKWYWEVKATDFNTYSSCRFGILDAAKPTVAANEYGYEDPSLAATNPEILAMSGAPSNWFMNSSSTITNNGSLNSVDYTFNEGDILAIALDMDNGGYWFGNSRYSGVANGSFWVAPGGTSTSGSVATTDPSNGNYALVGDGGGTNNGTPNFNGGTITGGSLLTAGFTLVTPTIGAYHSNTTVTLEVNFGGFTSYAEDGGYADANGHGNFAYAVPSGFYSLCSKNIAEFGGSG